MRQINFDYIFKILILIFFVYFLFLFTKISDSLQNGRYQFKTDSRLILDTKTGKVYYNKEGKLIEHKGEIPNSSHPSGFSGF